MISYPLTFVECFAIILNMDKIMVGVVGVVFFLHIFSLVKVFFGWCAEDV